MFGHDDIWRAIDRLAAHHGYSASGLARQAGLDPTSFNRSKRFSPEGKPRWPSTESLAKILSVTQSTMTDMMALAGIDGAQDSSAQKSIPLIGYAQAGKEGFFDDAGYPAGTGWEEIDFPNRHDPNMYALQVTGDSMEPLYREGGKIIVSPNADIRVGDRVVVKTTDGEITAKELSAETPVSVTLKSLNAAHDPRDLSLQNIDWIARILWVSQ